MQLHHLEQSRSFRVVWLLEEIGIEYELIRYQRTLEHRAPLALGQIHPLGKAPILVDGSLVLAESSAILRYLDRRYGENHFSPEPDTARAACHDQWLDFAEASLSPFVMVALIGRLTGGLSDAIAAMTETELTNNFNHFSNAIRGQIFLMGERPMLADIQISYTLQLASDLGLLAHQPLLTAYLERLTCEPGFLAAIARGGPMRLDLPRSPLYET